MLRCAERFQAPVQRRIVGGLTVKAADRPVLEEGATTCCYAKSEKSWISDPDGVVWEAFLTNGEATVYGDGPPLSPLSANAAAHACCAPGLAASGSRDQ